MKIESFSGDYRFLSNFFPCQVQYDGETYPSVEHAYQAAKTLDPQTRNVIRNCATAGRAKRLGRKVKLRPDWERVKIEIMKSLLIEKFSGADLADRLIENRDGHGTG